MNGWSYPAIVTDVRQVLPDADGNPRLLVETDGSSANVASQASLLVREDGQWRFRVSNLLEIGRPVARDVQVADILLGRDAYGPTGAGNFTRQLEAGTLVTMTIASVGDTPRQVIVAGQDLGMVAPGGSLIVQPFTVNEDSVAAAGGKLTFTIESVDLAAPSDAPAPRPMTIAVYSADSLEFNSTGMYQGTPVPSDIVGSAATPDPVTHSTPGATENRPEQVAVVRADETNRMVEIDQPWAVSTGTELVAGVRPVTSDECATPVRSSGAIIDLVTDTPARPSAELPGSLTPAESLALSDPLPIGSEADRAAAQGVFDQLSACRFETGSSQLPLEDRYTGPFWSLFSDDYLLRAIPEGEGRTAESLVRQVRLPLLVPPSGSYPDQVVEVRVHPPDRNGQPRLLVTFRSLTQGPEQQTGLLVLEQGTWRLAEVVASTVEPSSTPDDQGSSVPEVTVIDFDVAVPNSVSLNDWILADVPIAVTITNSGTSPSTVSLGDQDLGVVQPGGTIRVIPFVVPSAGSTALLLDSQLTVSASNPSGQVVETSWTVYNPNDRFPNGRP